MYRNINMIRSTMDLNTSFATNWINSCRLCLMDDGIQLEIFGEEGTSREVSHKIQACFPIVLYKTDPLPKKICHRCLFKLETIYEFRKQCVEINNALLNHLSSLKHLQEVRKYFTCLKETSSSSYKNVVEHIDKIAEFENPAPVPHVDKEKEKSKEVESHVEKRSPEQEKDKTEFQGVFLEEGSANIFLKEYVDDDEDDVQIISEDTVVETITILDGDGEKVVDLDIEDDPLSRSANSEKQRSSSLTSKELEERRYGCNICDKVFNRRFKLADHMREHETTTTGMIEEKPSTSALVQGENSATPAPLVKIETNNIEPTMPKRYYCNVCPAQYRSEQSLEEHCKIHDKKVKIEEPVVPQVAEPENLRCGVCSLTFSSRFRYDAHYSGHLKCSVCKTRFHSVTRKQDHVCPCRVYTATALIVCEPCGGATYSTASKLVVHRDRFHPDGINKCEMCKKQFMFRNDLYKHLLCHLSVKLKIKESDLHPCKCGRNFVHTKMLLYHQKVGCKREAQEYVEHVETEKRYECEICWKVFTKNEVYVSHKWSHIKEGVDVHICNVCNDVYTRVDKLKMHEATHNSEKEGTECKIPKLETSKTKVDAKNEIRSKARDVKRISFKCKKCPKTCSTFSKLRVHERTQHGKRELNEGKPEECKTANPENRVEEGSQDVTSGTNIDEDRTERNSDRLSTTSDAAVSSTGDATPKTGDEMFVCECTKIFRSYRKFVKHKESHSQNKRFPCKYCNERFPHSDLLWYHMKEVHSGDNSYKCSECHRTFNLVSALAKHRQVHLKAKQYMCKICGMKFSERDALKEHKNKSDGSCCKYHTCSICMKKFSNTMTWKIHVDIHEKVVEKNPELADAYKNLDSLKQNRTLAEKDGLLCCDFCNKTFPEAVALVSHLKDHAYETCNLDELNRASLDSDEEAFADGGEEDASYKCNYCGTRFKMKVQLQRHVARVHEELKVIPCDLCDKRFINSKAVLRHKGHCHPERTREKKECTRVTRCTLTVEQENQPVVGSSVSDTSSDVLKSQQEPSHNSSNVEPETLRVSEIEQEETSGQSSSISLVPSDQSARESLVQTVSAIKNETCTYTTESGNSVETEKASVKNLALQEESQNSREEECAEEESKHDKDSLNSLSCSNRSKIVDDCNDVRREKASEESNRAKQTAAGTSTSEHRSPSDNTNLLAETSSDMESHQDSTLGKTSVDKNREEFEGKHEEYKKKQHEDIKSTDHNSKESKEKNSDFQMTSDGRFGCSKCDKVFEEEDSFTSHFKKHTDSLDYHCKYCSSAYHSRHRLKSHIKHKHKEKYMEAKERKTNWNNVTSKLSEKTSTSTTATENAGENQRSENNPTSGQANFSKFHSKQMLFRTNILQNPLDVFADIRFMPKPGNTLGKESGEGEDSASSISTSNWQAHNETMEETGLEKTSEDNMANDKRDSTKDLSRVNNTESSTSDEIYTPHASKSEDSTMNLAAKDNTNKEIKTDQSSSASKELHQDRVMVETMFEDSSEEMDIEDTVTSVGKVKEDEIRQKILANMKMLYDDDSMDKSAAGSPLQTDHAKDTADSSKESREKS